MNKERRKRLEALKEDLDRALVELESITTDEQEAFDNMPEGLQCSERGESMEECIGILEGAIGDLEAVICGIDEVIQ